MLTQTLYQHPLPDSFFRPNEDRAYLTALFQLEAERNEVILYTNESGFRLVGMFPHDSGEALFGFWETPNDLAINGQAFAQLRADAQVRGRTTLVGPINFNTFHAYRLRLTASPSWGQFDREPAQPVYYQTILETLGFSVRSRFASRMIHSEDIPFAYELKEQLLASLAQMPFDVIRLNPDTWREHESELFELVHQVFSANPAYRPISNEQFRLLYNEQYAQKLCPHTSVLFRDRATRQLVAMSFCHPNYAELNLPPNDPPVCTRDFERLGRKVLLVRSVGVHPAYRKMGLMSFLGAYGMVHFRERYADVIFCLMRLDNFSMHFSDRMAYEQADYGLFEKVIVSK